MNSTMRCEDVDELDAAFALGALESDEARAVREHLRTCGNPHAELRQLASVAGAVPMTLDPLEPSPALRGRLMATVARTPQEAAPAPEPRAADPRVAIPLESRESRWLGWLSPRVVSGLAAASLAGVVALGAWNISLQGELSESERILQATAAALDEGGTAFRVDGEAGSGFLVESPDGTGSLIIAGLDDLSRGERYQMWLIAGDTTVTAGSFTHGDDELIVVSLDRPVADHDSFAVTVEDRPVDAPTGDPVMVGELTN